MVDQKDHRLTVKVKDGVVVISIGVDRLAHSAQHHKDFYDDDGIKHRITVTDPTLFAKEVARALMSEEEDGTTPIDTLLDNGIAQAIEDGCDGVDVRE